MVLGRSGKVWRESVVGRVFCKIRGWRRRPLVCIGLVRLNYPLNDVTIIKVQLVIYITL